MVGALVDEICLVPEAEIAAAKRRLFLAEGWVAEGAGAIGLPCSRSRIALALERASGY
jgi:threonine dehydratase